MTRFEEEGESPMKLVAAINIYLFICACAGLAYGLTATYRRKQPLYFRLMIFPIACQLFSRAFYIVTLLCYGELPDGFNIGFLGFAAFFLFLYLPNVGAIDNLLDEADRGYSRYRLLALILPAAELALAVFALTYDAVSLDVRISYAVLLLLAGFAGYFNLKHLIIPDVEGGIIGALRHFNALCIVFELLTLAEVGFYCCSLRTPVVIQALLGIVYVVFLPLLNKETKKWTQ